VPQAPQLLLLRETSTHELPHAVSPAGQLITQLPPEHMKPDAQALPQPPQFIGSVKTFEHWPLQTSSPTGQLATQLPPRQTLPGGQT